MKIFLAIIWFFCAAYLLYPDSSFPHDLPNSLKSFEPADTESLNRKAYFTNMTREQIMDFYKRNFVGILSYRLNYPPEEAQSLIRDQTQSSFLEEIVHFGKQSLFINGFVPIKPTEQININGVHYTTKVTVRYVPSEYIIRLTTLLLLSLVTLSLVKAYGKI
ncbi:MAG: hypothetical protein AAB768_00960 [Patescibacteria group bacterium]